MNYLNRQDLENVFKKVVLNFGKPKTGKIFSYSQLVSEVIRTLSSFDECLIVYENGGFLVSTFCCVKNFYSNDYCCFGAVRIQDWFSKEQIFALHELSFGYQF